jgi:hypothetical protein
MDGPPTGRQALVAACQWGFVQASLLATVGDLFVAYHRFTTDSVFVPGWILAVGLTVPVALLVGGHGGWTWVSRGYGERTRETHRRRRRFVLAGVVLWPAHLLPEVGLRVVLTDGATTLAGVLLGPCSTLAVLVGAYLLAYRVDPAVYDRLARVVGYLNPGARPSE